MANWKPKDAWRQFRLETEAAKNYWQPYALYTNQTHKDLLLERLLPTLLHIRGVAVLDDSLEGWLGSNGHRLATPYRANLFGRLEYMKDRSFLPRVDDLHAVRKRRNDFAHVPGTVCEWVVLEQDIETIEGALVALALVGATPHLEYFGERSAMKGSAEPGVSFERTFRYGVRANGVPSLEIEWTQRFMDGGSDAT